MSGGFAADWLALREGADRRARNRGMMHALSAWYALREHIHVVDLGSGTGANLRATAPLLPSRQTWRLADKDADLLSVARSSLRAWADTCEDLDDGRAVLRKGEAHITVSFETCDLASGFDRLVAAPCDLVTASALFDLASPAFIRSVARKVAEQRAGFYAAMTYNGLQKWAPHRPADSQMAAAFNRHQMMDKGLGPAAGPTAAALIADQFRLEGYSVQEGESPWQLGPSDRRLIEELQRGHAIAVLEMGNPDAKTVETWVKTIRSACEIGHTDIFAVPA